MPNYVGQLRNLKVLNVTENDLKTLPPTLCLCGKLAEIRIGYNRITSLPAYFMNMKHLERMERYSYSHANAPMIDVSERPGYPIMYVCDKEGEKIENNADGNEDNNNNKKNKVTSPDSLYRLAAYAALKHDFKMFSNTGSKVLPKHVVNDITRSLPSLRFCDNCHCGFAEKECKSNFNYLYYLITWHQIIKSSNTFQFLQPTFKIRDSLWLIQRCQKQGSRDYRKI